MYICETSTKIPLGGGMDAYNDYKNKAKKGEEFAPASEPYDKEGKGQESNS